MRMMKMSKKEKAGWGKFVLGAAVGGALGVLFAPKKGSETRRELKEKLDELVEKVKGIDANEVKEEIEAKIEEIKAGLKDLDKEKVLDIAKEKALEMKVKAEELVELAKEKGTPVLEKATEEVREKTLAVVKEIEKKLKK